MIFFYLDETVCVGICKNNLDEIISFCMGNVKSEASESADRSCSFCLFSLFRILLKSLDLSLQKVLKNKMPFKTNIFTDGMFLIRTHSSSV